MNWRNNQDRYGHVHIQGGIQKFQDFMRKNKLVFFCKHFIGRLRNSPLRTEYNDLHDQEDYRMLSMAVEAF